MGGLEGAFPEGLIWERPSSLLSQERATSSCRCCSVCPLTKELPQTVALLGSLEKTENKPILAFRAFLDAEDSWRTL